VTFRTSQLWNANASFMDRKKGTAMNTIHCPYQFHTVFGTGYMPEHHSDELHPNLLFAAPSERDFDSILERLRSALGIRRPNAG